jgi:hypothetical protein
MTPDVERPDLEALREFVADRPPIHKDAGRHDFVESEFATGVGRCDTCGGGPLAQIHQRPVDQTERAAMALELCAVALERIADELERPNRVGAFWRWCDWLVNFFKGFSQVKR